MKHYGFSEADIYNTDGFSVGHAQDIQGGTGVTVVYFTDGAQVGCDISGGGPASRETPLLSPTTSPHPINAAVFSGGSAYGLAAADGVMRCLEEHGIGLKTQAALVPLVCQSCIYDLSYKSADCRPTPQMGYEACEAALKRERYTGKLIGAATGATAGKLIGTQYASKTGLGTFALEKDGLYMAAIVVVNAIGDIIHPSDGRIISGAKKDGVFINSRRELIGRTEAAPSAENTTLGIIITNAKFNKAELTKLASMTRNAYSRCICPVGTLADGDTIYAASVGDVNVGINAAGTLAAYVMEQAILNAAEI